MCNYTNREKQKKGKDPRGVFKELNKKVRFRMIRNHLPKKKGRKGEVNYRD